MSSNNFRLFFVLLSSAAAIGLGNIWIYPYLSFKFTSLFLIPYSIALLILGMPLLMLEFSIGQHFNKNIVDLFASIRKGFSSIGWLMLFNAFILIGYYTVMLSWHILYIFVSFGLQWKNDAKGYFLNNVLQVSGGFGNFTQFSLPVFVALILAWLVIFLCIRHGFDSLKKGIVIAFPVFAVLMLLFLFYSLTLDNALAGVYSVLKPNFRNLLNSNIWLAAFSLAASSLGLSIGVMHVVGMRDKGTVVGASSIVVVLEILVSIVASFIVFGFLGFISMKQGIGLDELAFSDFGSGFTILVQALPYFYKPTLLSLLFFAFLSLFFIFGAASLAYSICHVFMHKFNVKKIYAAIIVACFGFLFSLLFIISPGFYIMDIVIHFIYYNLLIGTLLEVVAIGWFFDCEKISSHINQYSIVKIGSLWRFIIRYITPILLLLLLFVHLKSDFLLNYKNYPLHYVLIFGVGTVVLPLIAAFLMPQRILDRR
ncbi:MAG: hypothetical protein AABX33_08770 [Nanoarchaeota archaeon]